MYIDIYIYIFLIHYSISGHLEWLHILVIVNNTAIKKDVQVEGINFKKRETSRIWYL